MFKKPKNHPAFTLIELLVVIAVIGLLSTLAVVALNSAREKARDAQRLSDMKAIQTALDLYHDKNNEQFPGISGDACCDGWDQGPCGADPFIGALDPEFIPLVPTDPSDSTGTGCYGYRYYRYSAGSYGCDASRGNYYVLGVTNMETSGNPHPSSPGWSCPSRNWQGEFEWVTGKFEK